MNIVQLFENAALKYPNRLAIVENKQSIIYKDLHHQVKLTATYFSNKGIKKGDRVMIFIPMSIDLYRIVLALFYIGATAVFLDEWVSRKRLDLCCDLADCKGFIGIRKARMYSIISKSLRQIPIKLSPNKQASIPTSRVDVSPEDAALITFTTGSTGIPKAAERSHQFLQKQFDALLDEIHPQPSDVDMTLLPIVLFVNLGTGCTSVIADFKIKKLNESKIKKIVHQIQSNNVNRIIASPFFIKKTAEYCIKYQVNLSHVEAVFTGGAPVFPEDAKLFLNGFSNANIQLVYGSTEAEPISSITAIDLVANQSKLESGLPVGEVYHKIQLKIIAITDAIIVGCNGLASLDDGVIGEIVVAGDHVLKRYFKNDEAFARNKIICHDTIWHRTGDSGYMQDGQLYLTGRCQQLIETEGEVISPFIVENYLQTLDGVTMGTIIQSHQKIIIVVETHKSKDEIKVLLVRYDYDQLVKMKEIPRDPRHHSKIDYAKLNLLVK